MSSLVLLGFLLLVLASVLALRAVLRWADSVEERLAERRRADIRVMYHPLTRPRPVPKDES